MALSDNQRPAPRPGLIQRAASAARYLISGVTPETWMSPLQPLRPMAEGTKGRAFDYPVAWNLNYIPRATERVSFQRLKMLSTNWDLLRLIIERRKDQIEALDWTIRPREQTGTRKGQRDAGSKHKAAIDEITTFFQFPDKRHDWAQWIRGVLDQHMVYDGVAIYKRPTRGQKLWGLELQDAATIKILIDGDGRIPQPPSPAFQQVLKGLPTSNYTTYTGGEMMYVVQNVRADHVYGYSRVEQIIWRVETAIQRVSSQLAYFTEGNVPDSFFLAPDGMTSDQIAALQVYWDGIFAGNVPQKRRGWWLPHGSDAKSMKDKPLTDEFDEWLARVACYAFSVSPQPFVQRMNRATAESAQQTAESEGNAPTIKFVSRLVNRIIAEDFQHPELEFSFDLDEEFDPVKAAVMNSTYVRAGIKTIDEVRDDLGEETKGGAAATLLYATPTGFVPIDPQEAAALVAANKPPPPIPFGGAPGKQPPASGKVPPASGRADASKLAKSIVRSLYVNRPLLNSYDLVEWARGQGFDADAIDPNELHVTLAYSKTPVDWGALGEGEPLVVVDAVPDDQAEDDPARSPRADGDQVEDDPELAPQGPIGSRSVGRLGDDGAIVLHLDSAALRARWQELCDAGAAWAYPEYQPHVTITYAGHPDLESVRPYTGQLIFGAEERLPIGEDGWATSAAELDAAAAEADRTPTRAQVAAGNYGKGHVVVQGLDVTIESAAGSIRRGTSPDGIPWEVEMPTHYGYVRRSLGADGEQVDVFLGPNPSSDRVWLLDQIDANTGAFDEHKILLGYDNVTEAVNDYTKSFSDDRGFERIQDVTELTVPQLKTWLKAGDPTAPAGAGWMKSVQNYDPRLAVREDPAYLQRRAKRPKAAVGYSRATSADRCGKCRHFGLHPPDFEAGACELVAGIINPVYWCELFEAGVGKSAGSEIAEKGFSEDQPRDADGRWGSGEGSHLGKPSSAARAHLESLKSGSALHSVKGFGNSGSTFIQHPNGERSNVTPKVADQLTRHDYVKNDPKQSAPGHRVYTYQAGVGKSADVPFPRSEPRARLSDGRGALTKTAARKPGWHPLVPNLHTRPQLKAAVVRMEGRVREALREAERPILAYVRAEFGKVAKADDNPEGEDARLTEVLSSLEVLINATEDDLETVAADGAREALATLGVEATSDLVNQVNERAAQWASERAAELVSKVTDSTRNLVRDVIASGLADGDRADDLASRLEEVGFGEKRAHLIANTEVANANSHGALNGYQQAQENGVDTLKEWLTDDEPCPICEENASVGPIPLDEDFPSGDDAPQAHPGCLCALIPWVADGSEEGSDEE